MPHTTVFPTDAERSRLEMVLQTRIGQYGLLPGTMWHLVTQFITSHKERQISIHLSKIKQGKISPLSKFVKRIHQEIVLIPDLTDGMAYTCLLSDRFKFSLAKQKETSLARPFKKVVDFIRAAEIYADTIDGQGNWGNDERSQPQLKRKIEKQRSGLTFQCRSYKYPNKD